MSHIPKEGLKIICIGGYIEGKPIWKTVGSIRMSSNNKVIINLDRTFNPAGVNGTDSTGPTVMLSALPYSQEELQQKEQYKSRKTTAPNQTTKQYQRSSSFDDMDDDIPF